MLGGITANSLALMSDALHLGSDLAGFLVSLFALWLAKRPPSATLTYGYYRAGRTNLFITDRQIFIYKTIKALQLSLNIYMCICIFLNRGYWCLNKCANYMVNYGDFNFRRC